MRETDSSYRLAKEVVRYAEEIISQSPKIDIPDHLALDPTVELIIGHTRYAIQSDEIILMHDGGTKIWSAPNIREKLIKAKQNKNKPNHSTLR